MQLVTKSEYARRRGCSEGAVRRAVRDGRIALIDGKVDPVAADAQWARNTRVRAGSRPTNDANLQSSDTYGRRDDETSGDYWASKSRREAAEAETAELKLSELKGELVRADAVRVAHARRLAAAREALLQLPARMVPLLVADPTPAAMDLLIRAEIVAVLAQIAEA